MSESAACDHDWRDIDGRWLCIECRAEKPYASDAASNEGLTDEQAQDVHDALSDALDVPREPLAASTLGFSRRPKSWSAHGRHWHFFVFKWGVTLRWRRHNGDWTHVSANTRVGQWRHDPSRHSRIWQVETWRTANGTRERVSGSKRYIRLKVAI